jgi:hypothetical protein
MPSFKYEQLFLLSEMEFIVSFEEYNLGFIDESRLQGG